MLRGAVEAFIEGETLFKWYMNEMNWGKVAEGMWDTEHTPHLALHTARNLRYKITKFVTGTKIIGMCKTLLRK
jgi:hypothetical protein